MLSIPELLLSHSWFFFFKAKNFPVSYLLSESFILVWSWGRSQDFLKVSVSSGPQDRPSLGLQGYCWIEWYILESLTVSVVSVKQEPRRKTWCWTKTWKNLGKACWMKMSRKQWKVHVRTFHLFDYLKIMSFYISAHSIYVVMTEESLCLFWGSSFYWSGPDLGSDFCPIRAWPRPPLNLAVCSGLSGVHDKAVSLWNKSKMRSSVLIFFAGPKLWNGVENVEHRSHTSLQLWCKCLCVTINERWQREKFGLVVSKKSTLSRKMLPLN